MRTWGQICLLLAFIGFGYAAFALYVGCRISRAPIRRSGWLAAVLSLIAVTSAMGILAVALLAKDFRFEYVAQYTSRQLPWHYSLSSLWVGQAGSLLLWCWLTSLLAVIFRVVPAKIPGSDELRDPAVAVIMAFCCFLTANLVFAVDPMAASVAAPTDGIGLNPLLQHPAMLIHPPIVFLAYAAWAIPCALVVAALATNQLSTHWIQLARPWALLAWTVLGGGILVGANWAYCELGWGGYWAWDPVENASLIPWLVGTCAIHAMMSWRHRGMFKKTTLGLMVSTFIMCNFATFLTRSGIFSSLHAFSRSPIGWAFLVLLLLIGVVAIVLIWIRREGLQGERSLGSLWSRESMVALTTVALMSLAVVVCIGTLSVAISDVILGRKVMVGPAFYNNALMPIGLIVLTAMAAAPLLRWGKAPSRQQVRWLITASVVGIVVGASTLAAGVRQSLWIAVVSIAGFAVVTLLGCVVLDTSRLQSRTTLALFKAVRTHRRQYGGFVIHMGLICMAIGITASSFGSRRREIVLRPGEEISWAGCCVQLVELVHRNRGDKFVVEAHLNVQQPGTSATVQTPAQYYYRHAQEWTTETSVASSWLQDVYIILNREVQGGVSLTLILNPMMRWIWLGGFVMLAGSITGLWPARLRPSAIHRLAPVRLSHDDDSGARARVPDLVMSRT